MIKLGGFFGRRLGPLLKASLALIENMFKHLAKSILVSLELIASVLSNRGSYLKEKFWMKHYKISIFKLTFEWYHENC